MQTGDSNPYAAPVSDVRNTGADEYDPVKIFSISGRMGRLRYLAYLTALILIVWLGGSVLMAMLLGIVAAMGSDASTMAIPLIILIYGAMLIGSFMLAIQRVHDFDTTGWITLLFLVPVVNMIFSLILLFMPGSDGENRFGKKTPPNGTGVKIMAVMAPVSFIVIIGILAAIAIPQFNEYQKRAQEARQAR